MNEVDVRYRKRHINISQDKESGMYVIHVYGYPEAYAKNWDELEQELEKLHEKERVRLSYKKA